MALILIRLRALLASSGNQGNPALYIHLIPREEGTGGATKKSLSLCRCNNTRVRIYNKEGFLFSEFERLVPETGVAHSLAVARRCEEVGGRELFWAGLFHDIGKSEEIAHSSFHPLDGARYLQSIGESDLAFLVARHSGAVEEARILGISLYPWEEEKFPKEQRLLDRIDLTTSPEGETVTLEERLEDIRIRYGADSTEVLALERAFGNE